MKKFLLKTMGCKSNQFEGQIIEKNLLDNGFEKVNTIKDADYYILNSCTVTQNSDKEVLYLLRNAKHLNPNIKTILTGCLAQVDKESLKQHSYIDYLMGNDDKFNIPELLDKNERVVVGDIMDVGSFNQQILTDTSKTRINLKVQDGCDSRCSYCIIPFARGKSRSADLNFITTQINKYAEAGFNEVILTGIHIGQWGTDFNKTFLDLIKAIESDTSIPRYRIGSLNPTEITPDVLNCLQNSKRFCPHFHLSLQSACNRTLMSMNRFYSVHKFLKQIDFIYENFDKPFIGSDIIAGFAGETNDDFEITVKNLRRSKLSKIHTFPYSLRKNTFAENMAGHLPDNIKEYRAGVIKSISKEKHSEFLNNNIETIQEVLIEKHTDKNTGKLKGLSKNYINVIIDEDLSQEVISRNHNVIRKVKLERVEGDKIYGKFLE